LPNLLVRNVVLIIVHVIFRYLKGSFVCKGRLICTLIELETIFLLVTVFFFQTIYASQKLVFMHHQSIFEWRIVHLTWLAFFHMCRRRRLRLRNRLNRLVLIGSVQIWIDLNLMHDELCWAIFLGCTLCLIIIIYS
jgi:hypothetical protein